MSTPVTISSRRANLISIFHYGKECLLNRWKMLLLSAFYLIFLPRLLATITFAKGSTAFVKQVREGALNSGPLLDLVVQLAATTLEPVLLVDVIALLLALVGALTTAKLSVDYFEQRPVTIASAMQSGAKTLLFKGLGATVMLLLVMIPTSVMTILRVIVLCLMVMLPLELVSGHNGGMRSVLNALFLRYATPTSGGRWPIFSNMMTIGGLFLSVMFLIQLGLSYLLNIDVLLGVKAAWWIQEIHLFGGTVSRGFLITHLLELAVDSTLIAVAMPFAAALRHFSQKSTFEMTM